MLIVPKPYIWLYSNKLEIKNNTLEKDIECFTHSLSIEEGNSEHKNNINEHSKYLKKGNNKDYFMIV